MGLCWGILGNGEEQGEKKKTGLCGEKRGIANQSAVLAIPMILTSSFSEYTFLSFSYRDTKVCRRTWGLGWVNNLTLGISKSRPMCAPRAA